MQASFQSAASLRQIVDAVVSTVQEASFEFTPDGASFRAMDPSHVSLVKLDLPLSFFSAYVCHTPTTVCMSLVHLGKILKTAAPTDALVLQCAPDPDVLYIKIEGPERVAEYELKLMIIDNERLDIPDLVSDAVFELPSKSFQTLISNLVLLDGDVVDFEVEDVNTITMTASGGLATGKEKLPISSATKLPVGLKVGFQLKYMSMFSKAASLSPTVRIEFSAQAPMILTFGFLSFYLAPKLEAE